MVVYSTYLCVNDAVQDKDEHSLGCDNHKEDPLNHCNVCRVVTKDEQPKKPAESQDREQDEGSS